VYTAAQAARLAGCTGSQLRYWERTDLVVPTGENRSYTFRDLVALRVVTSLLEAGLPLARVRVALTFLAESGEDLSGVRLVTDGVTVWACRDDGQILDALRAGQLALFVSVEQFVESLEADVRAFDAERSAFVADLVARERSSAAHPSSPRPGREP
jgi:DNA-binding transcriptional MerR regulator